jgi:hypothetical protein
MDAPPTEITVGGKSYTIRTDFRVWIAVLATFRQLLTTIENDDDVQHNADVLVQLMLLVFPELPLWEDVSCYDDFIRALSEFIAGYAHAPVSSSTGAQNSVQTYSFEHDLNEIVIAISCQFGVDLTVGHECHWWLFLEYFRCLSGNHQIIKLMEIRGYDGKDPELKRRAAQFALPNENSADDDRALKEINELFYGA